MRYSFSKAFIRGFLRSFDISAAARRYPNLDNGRIADYEALKGDWENVGKYITEATAKYGKAVTA